jgi:hypothetical protein
VSKQKKIRYPPPPPPEYSHVSRLLYVVRLKIPYTVYRTVHSIRLPSNFAPNAVTMMRRIGCLVLAILCNAAAGEYTAVMDLSYKPHLKAATISHAIRHAIDERPSSTVELDVSFSDLGNEGIASVLQSLQTKELYLSARMNRLTPEGVANMFNSILGDDNKNESLPPFLLQSLDLGWNNLGPDQTGSKEFLSSLRRLIELPEKCPRVLRLCKCGLGPAACRAIGKVSP